MPSAGCYDAAALLKSRREAHDAVAHEEIDLGKFSIVLPHAAGAAGGKKIEFHAFGHVARSDRSAVSGALTDSAAKLHSHMLMSVRSLSSSELEEPQLDSLRRRIAEVVNSSLDGQRIENVGFYEFTLATNEPQ